MFTATTLLIGSLMFAPVAAPVPADPPPDPLGRGYLGASFKQDSPTNELEIASVEPNKPAANAGILTGDTVVRVGTAAPTTFKELVAHITAYRPGAVVEVEVVRNGEHKTVQVTLAARPPSVDRGSSPVPDFPHDK